MLDALSSDIHGEIAKHLNVSDRVKMSVALSDRCHANRQRERKLGILARGIRKGRLKKLTGPIRTFLLESCDRRDPTLKEIGDAFPEIKASLMLPMGKQERTLSTIQGDCKVLYNAQPTEFQDMIKNIDGLRAWIQEVQKSFYFNLFNYANEDLLTYITSADVACSLGFDIPSLNCYVKQSYKPIPRSMHVSLWTQPRVRQLLLKFVPHSVEELELVWTYCMGAMDTNAASDIDNAIQSLMT